MCGGISAVAPPAAPAHATAAAAASAAAAAALDAAPPALISLSAGAEHVFHAHCVGEGEGGKPECPLCAPAQSQTLSIRAKLLADATAGGGDRLAEQFHRELAASADGFAKVAAYLSRGVFDPAVLGAVK
jgi:hypothetical protein